MRQGNGKHLQVSTDLRAKSRILNAAWMRLRRMRDVFHVPLPRVVLDPSTLRSIKKTVRTHVSTGSFAIT